MRRPVSGNLIEELPAIKRAVRCGQGSERAAGPRDAVVRLPGQGRIGLAGGEGVDQVEGGAAIGKRQ